MPIGVTSGLKWTINRHADDVSYVPLTLAFKCDERRWQPIRDVYTLSYHQEMPSDCLVTGPRQRSRAVHQPAKPEGLPPFGFVETASW